MLKLIGVALISLALAAAGFAFAAQAKRRLDSLEDAQHAVELLRTQITHLLLPLPEAICALQSQNPLLKRLADAGCPAGGTALRAVLSKAALSQPESDILEALFAAIPRLSMENTGVFEAAREQLAVCIGLQRKAVQQGASLYPKLGLLAGAAALILFI